MKKTNSGDEKLLRVKFNRSSYTAEEFGELIIHHLGQSTEILWYSIKTENK